MRDLMNRLSELAGSGWQCLKCGLFCPGRTTHCACGANRAQHGSR
ncbi:hypothetical protein OHV05_17220 [Kitasatospora sp. NBC_00070]